MPLDAICVKGHLAITMLFGLFCISASVLLSVMHSVR